MWEPAEIKPLHAVADAARAIYKKGPYEHGFSDHWCVYCGSRRRLHHSDCAWPTFETALKALDDHYAHTSRCETVSDTPAELVDAHSATVLPPGASRHHTEVGNRTLS